MKLDTDILVDVEVYEAAAMIELIELLFESWYVDHHNRAERLRKMTHAISKREGGDVVDNHGVAVEDMEGSTTILTATDDNS